MRKGGLGLGAGLSREFTAVAGRVYSPNGSIFVHPNGADFKQPNA